MTEPNNNCQVNNDRMTKLNQTLQEIKEMIGPLPPVDNSTSQSSKQNADLSQLIKQTHAALDDFELMMDKLNYLDIEFQKLSSLKTGR